MLAPLSNLHDTNPPNSKKALLIMTTTVAVRRNLYYYGSQILQHPPFRRNLNLPLLDMEDL